MADPAAALTMPDAFQHYCAEPACREKTAGRFCPAHERADVQRYDRDRGSSAARGYGRKWQRYVTRFRARYPICGDRPAEAPATYDSVCTAKGILRPMFVVDHIRPVSGPDDPSFYDPANHQALCESCHNSKRRRERGGVFPGGTRISIGAVNGEGDTGTRPQAGATTRGRPGRAGRAVIGGSADATKENGEGDD